MPPTGGTAKRRVRVLDGRLAAGQGQLGPIDGRAIGVLNQPLIAEERQQISREPKRPSAEFVAFLHAPVSFSTRTSRMKSREIS